jgi:pantoate--beta-alanine ligase
VRILRSIADVHRTRAPLGDGSIVALVPTMGALHAGHVALFQAARRECEVVVASVFVNPSQFSDPNDLAAYPRDEAHDAQIATEAGVDYLFAPSVEEMYPPGYATWIDVGGAAAGFEGDFRPGHFRGVATICLKLFTIVRPGLAFFGQKDAQQVAVIQQVVRDLHLDLQIRVVPTVRAADGLALSSRNVRLSAPERERALKLPRALDAGAAAFRAGRDPVAAARHVLADTAVDYLAVADFSGRPTLVVAAWIGATRLIDNVPLDRRDVPQPIAAAAAQESKNG